MNINLTESQRLLQTSIRKLVPIVHEADEMNRVSLRCFLSNDSNLIDCSHGGILYLG